MALDTNELGQSLGEPVPNWTSPPLPARETMQGRFCRLEPLDANKHGRDLYAANSLDTKGSSWTYLPYGPFASFEDYFAWLEQSAATNDPMYFTIIDLKSGKAVGIGSYLRIDPRHGSIEIGHLNFSPLLQATPASTEAQYLFIRYAFGLGYRRYEWKCNSLNLPSRRAAQRLGLSYEGTFRQAAVYKGRNRDTAWYAAIDKEWPALKSAFEQWLDPQNFDAVGKQKQSLTVFTSSILKNRG